jgi:hypothetical protein
VLALGAASGVFVFLVAHLAGRVLRWRGRVYDPANDVRAYIDD